MVLLMCNGRCMTYSFYSGQEWSEGDIMASKRKQDETDEPMDDRKFSLQLSKII